jgi:hypothetical protein
MADTDPDRGEFVAGTTGGIADLASRVAHVRPLPVTVMQDVRQRVAETFAVPSALMEPAHGVTINSSTCNLVLLLLTEYRSLIARVSGDTARLDCALASLGAALFPLPTAQGTDTRRMTDGGLA